MKNIAFILLSIIIFATGIEAQETKITEANPPKLSKLDQEKIQANGFAFAEANCRYELSTLKLQKDRKDNFLIEEVNRNGKLLSEIMQSGQQKYSDAILFSKYMEYFNEAQGKLNSCIRMNKLKEQNKLEQTPKK